MSRPAGNVKKENNNIFYKKIKLKCSFLEQNAKYVNCGKTSLNRLACYNHGVKLV